MSVTQSVAQMLRERVTLEVESIGRLYLNVYVPKPQRVGAWSASSARYAGPPSPPRR